MINSTQGLGGSTPQFNTGGRSPKLKPLYHSYVEQALILEKFVMPGFGDLQAGTVMAKYSDKFVPYVPVAVATSDVGRVFITNDAAAAKIAYMPNRYASRFAVGETLVCKTDDDVTDQGAITAIDIDDIPGMTKVTVTTNFTANATVAKSANLYHKTATGSPFSTAVGIIDTAVTTGEYVEGGVAAQGAQVSYVVSNAILYLDALVGLDSAAITALGVVSDSPYVIVK